MKTRTSKLLLVDGNNLFYRAYFSHGKLASFNGQNVSGIFGLLSILSAMLTRFTIDEVIICWDGKKDKNRLTIWPEYKAKRKKIGHDYEDMNTQKAHIRKLLHYLGVKQIINDMEADDLIYQVVKERRKEKKPIIILSTDKDFDQLVSKRVWIWNEKVGQIITPKSIKRLKGYNADQCVDYLCLKGDDSDNIPGYRGLGDKGIERFFQSFESIEQYFRDNITFKGLVPEKLKEVYLRNKMMICLRTFNRAYYPKLKLEYYKSESPTLRKQKYIELAASLGLRKFREDKFINIFKRLNNG